MTSAAHDERRRILKMVQDGRITAEDAARLIGAIAASDTTAAGGPRGRDPMGGDAAPDPDLALAVLPPASPPAPGPTWLRVRVTDVATGDPQVDIKVP
ncbi:MAG: hypothetical protein ACE5EL_02985, partial [Anaerolineae bacterium]